MNSLGPAQLLKVAQLAASSRLNIIQRRLEKLPAAMLPLLDSVLESSDLKARHKRLTRDLQALRKQVRRERTIDRLNGELKDETFELDRCVTRLIEDTMATLDLMTARIRRNIAAQQNDV